MREQQAIETPSQLGERYSRELRELVQQGEISPTLARQVMNDMFISGDRGEPPRLRWSAWRTYVSGLTGDHS